MKGNLVNWWQEDTLKEFTTRAQCFIDQVKKSEMKKLCSNDKNRFFSSIQYSNYKHPVLNLTVGLLHPILFECISTELNRV